MFKKLGDGYKAPPRTGDTGKVDLPPYLKNAPPPKRTKRWDWRWLVAVILMSLLAWLVIEFRIKPAVERAVDDFHYGRPRIHRHSIVTGTLDNRENPSELIAMNINRQIVVLFVPGLATDQVKVLNGPHVWGSDDALTPVVLNVRQVDDNETPDMVLDVGGERITYLFVDGAWRLATPEETSRFASNILR
jgi:hypothetical protein